MPTKRHTRKLRPSPSESATSLPEGTIRKGGNKQYWVVKKIPNGTHRWMHVESAELNGWRKLTVDYMERMIGKEITIYLREYSNTWPSRNEMEPSMTFTPNGHAQINNNKKHLDNWLHTRAQPIRRGQYFYILGEGYYVNDTRLFTTLQVDSTNGQTVSPNLMNMEAFVRI